MYSRKIQANIVNTSLTLLSYLRQRASLIKVIVVCMFGMCIYFYVHGYVCIYTHYTFLFEVYFNVISITFLFSLLINYTLGFITEHLSIIAAVIVTRQRLIDDS